MSVGNAETRKVQASTVQVCMYASMVFVLNLVVVDLTIVLLRLPDDAYVQWPSGFSFHNTIQSTLLVLCTGVPFTLNFLWWMLAAALYYGLSIYVLISNEELIQSELEMPPISADIAFYNYQGSFFWYGVILLIGSYFKDITSRKSFLQRILLLQQQSQIIRAKTKKERTQRGFLETQCVHVQRGGPLNTMGPLYFQNISSH